METSEVRVNGYTLKELEQLLVEPFPIEKTKETRSGDLSIPIDSYEQRMNEVVGIMNYDFICSEAKFETFVTVNNGLEKKDSVIYVMARMTIKDDLGRPVVTKSACGGSNVIIINDTGRPKSLKSDMDTAVSEAYKNCCKKLGIGVRQMRQAKREMASSGKRSETQAELNAGDLQMFSIRLKTKLQSGSSFYWAKAVDIETGDEYKFMLFKKEYPEFERQITVKEAVERSMPDTTQMTFAGRIMEYRGVQQLVFARWKQ